MCAKVIFHIVAKVLRLGVVSKLLKIFLLICKRKIPAWTRVRTRVSSFMRWWSKQLSHPDDPMGQARILLLLDRQYPPDYY